VGGINSKSEAAARAKPYVAAFLISRKQTIDTVSIGVLLNIHIHNRGLQCFHS
jgi:ribosomal protein L31E